MNPRTVFFSFFGWCPGVRAAARFMPDRDIQPSSVLVVGILSSTLIMGVAFYLSIQTVPSSWRPLKVYIDDVVYDDEIFTKSFNYTEIRDKDVRFNIPLNVSQLVRDPRSIGYAQVLEFKSASDAVAWIKDWDTPNIVTGFAEWLSNGTYDKVYLRYYGRGPYNLPPNMGGYLDIGKSFGHVPRTAVCDFQVRRETWVPALDPGLMATDVVTIWKSYNTGASSVILWRFYVILEGVNVNKAVFVSCS
jgi:hypothetical protein